MQGAHCIKYVLVL